MTATTTPTTTSPPEDTSAVLEQLEVAHSAGMQFRLVALDLSDQGLRAVLEVSNGSPLLASIEAGRAVLVDRGGNEIGAVQAPPTMVSPGEDRRVTIPFEMDGAADLEEVTIRLPSPSAVADPVELGPASLDSHPAPPLPEAFAISERADHPTASQFTVEGIGFTESRIGVQVRLETGDQPAVLTSGESTYVEDDLGNRYLMVPADPAEEEPEIPGGTEVAGVLSMAGRVHPDAESLSLVVNGGIGGTDSPITIKPRWDFGPWPVEGHEPAPANPLPEPATFDQRRTHPDGSEAVLRTLTFESDVIRATVEIQNAQDYPIQIVSDAVLGDTVVTDDTGRTYPLLLDESGGVVEVPAGQGLEAELVFSGRLEDAATSLSVRVNDGTVAMAEGPRAVQPTFIWEDLPVDRPSGGTDQTAWESPIVGQRSELLSSDVDRTSAEVVARITTRFDGTETEDGVLLTVPDNVLFEFGSADLRQDARATVADIAAVLAYYDDAPAELIGHTDSIGSDEFNQQLSEARAAAVRDALVEDHGLDPDRLPASGRGESDPVVPNTLPDGSDDPEGRQQNRRVEVLVQTDKPLPSDG